ncbi:MAG: protein kinase [Acidobacteriaceae bacterium]|nr:protein kinase [Acidobacteriaceae bacterium]
MPPEKDRGDPSPAITQPISDEQRRMLLEKAGRVRSQANRFHPGAMLAGRFVILRFLGRGGVGEVYEAEDRFLQGARVALKTILHERAAEPGAQKRLEREVLLARQITHPNVCPVYDLFYCSDTEGCPCFLTMKLVEGETLEHRLRHLGRIPTEEAVLILRQIASALFAAHQAGVIHRDLKPGNIMLEGTGAEVKAIVTDFGLAREDETRATTATGTHIWGTPGYIAPEVWSGHPATPASDLYALGVLLYETFTGNMPVIAPVSQTAADLQAANVPRFCSRLITACLSVDPAARYEGFEQAMRVVNPDSGQLHIYPFVPSWTRRRILSTAGAAAALAASGGVAWHWDALDNLLHPLPRKRFVALLTWPPTTDQRARPILTGVLDAIETELARAEAIDRDLFVISPHTAGVAPAPARLEDVRDSLGANLVLAASGVANARQFQLSLRVFDAWSKAVLRERNLVYALKEFAALPVAAVRVAARLLNVHFDNGRNQQPQPGTNSAAAYVAFESAQDLMKQPNDTGLDAAIAKYHQALDLDPRYAQAYGKLALAYCRLYGLRRDFAALDLARGNAENALRFNRDSVDGHLAIAEVLRYRGQATAAIEEFDRALSLDPSNPRTLDWRARAYEHLDHWSDAEQSYREILRNRPNYWVAYNELGWLFQAQGKYRNAIDAFRAATLAAPNSTLALNNLGEMYLKTGASGKAMQCFQKSLGLKPDDTVYVCVATALRATGKYAEAVSWAQKAANLNQSDHENWLQLGDCLSFLPNRKAASQAYLRAATELDLQLQTDPTDGSSWMFSTLYRVKAGSRDGALELVRKAESLGARDLESQLMKVRILELLGRRKEALAALATCFNRGITRFEVEYTADLQGLRKDPDYSRIATLRAADNKS